jgi:hypothetical protein
VAGWGGGSKLYRNDGGTFTDIGAGLTDVYYCSLAWGDYDNDGDLDLALAGVSSGGRISKVYRNDGAAGFTDIVAGMTGVSNCSFAWGDYDNDGDLDLALAGYVNGTTRISKVYRNNGGVFNTAPAAPTGLGATYTGGGPYNVTFSWAAPAVADETPEAGLSYNLRVGTTPGGDEIMSGMAITSPDVRLIPAMGNGQQNLSWTLKSLTGGIYYWSVQAVDTAFAGSPWAAEEAAGIRVTSPNGGETWYFQGPDQTITWTSGGVAGNVDIDYSADGGDTWTAVAINIADTGSYNWTIPNENSANCLVRVQETGGGGFSDTSDAAFTIASPSITVLAPNGGETWYYQGADQTITWGSGGVAGNVDIHYSADAGSTWNAVAVDIANTGSYTWTTPNEDSSQCLVWVEETGGAGLSDTSDAPFRIFPQVIAVTLPASATEGDGTLVGAGMVSILMPLTADLVIDLASSDTTELTVPATVTILQGDTAATFDITAEKDGIHDLRQTVTVTALAWGCTGGSATMDILNEDSFTWGGGGGGDNSIEEFFEAFACGTGAGSPAGLLCIAAAVPLVLRRRRRRERAGRG